MTIRAITLAVPFLALLSSSLTAFSQTSPGIDTLPAEDQEIVRGLAFKKWEPSPLASRRWSYIKGEIEVENTGPKNSIAGKLHADMSLLFLNKDHDWVVVSCGSDFAITTTGQEAIHLSFKESNNLFETLFGDRKAPSLTTHTIVRYGGVVIFEDPLDPKAANAPREWWTHKTGVIGHYNQLYIVVDKADQVVAIQLVSESPKVDQVDVPSKPTDWHTYNFVNSRTKGTKRLWIDHKPWFEDKKGWREYSATNAYRQPKGELEVLRIDTVLLDPDLTTYGNRGQNWKPLEAVRLYLPKPMMELILQCVNTSKR